VKILDGGHSEEHEADVILSCVVYTLSDRQVYIAELD
jgi:hypothetical protein